MGYVRTAGMSTAARRRRRRAALILSGLLLALALVGAYAVAYVQGWLPEAGGGTDDQQVTSAPPSVPALAPGDVTVNVYNASGAPGIAAAAAEALQARGFDVDTVANDPERADVPHVADIRHGESGAAAAAYLAEQVPGARLVPDARQSSEVDLVLGDEWTELPATDGQQTGDGGDEG